MRYNKEVENLEKAIKSYRRTAKAANWISSAIGIVCLVSYALTVILFPMDDWLFVLLFLVFGSPFFIAFAIARKIKRKKFAKICAIKGLPMPRKIDEKALDGLVEKLEGGQNPFRDPKFDPAPRFEENSATGIKTVEVEKPKAAPTKMKTQNCPRCGYINEKGRGFCRQCGAPLPHMGE